MTVCLILPDCIATELMMLLLCLVVNVDTYCSFH